MGQPWRFNIDGKSKKSTIESVLNEAGWHVYILFLNLYDIIDAINNTINSHNHDSDYYPLTGGELQGGISSADDNSENCGSAANRWAEVHTVTLKAENLYADGSQGIRRGISYFNSRLKRH